MDKCAGCNKDLTIVSREVLLSLVELYPDHDFSIQLMKLKNTLRTIMGEEVIHHTGLDYYE